MADCHRRDFRDGLVADEHVAGSSIQPRALAVRAGLAAQELGQLLADHAGVGFAVPALEVRQDAFELVLAIDADAVAGDVAELDLLLAAALEQDLLDLCREFPPGQFDVEVVVLRQALDHGEVVRIAPVPAADGTAGQAQLGVAHDPFLVEELLHAEAVAGRARTGRVIE